MNEPMAALARQVVAHNGLSALGTPWWCGRHPAGCGPQAQPSPWPLTQRDHGVGEETGQFS
jgi:hypothetical protein